MSSFGSLSQLIDAEESRASAYNSSCLSAPGRYREAHPQVVAAFLAALDRAMASIRDHPEEAAAVWVRAERSRLGVPAVAGMIRQPENEWTTTPRRVMDFMAFMQATGALAARADTWRDLFFPEIHHLPGS